MTWNSRLKLSIILVTLAIILSGCWDNIEVRELGVVMGIGLDYEEGDEPIQLTIQIVTPSPKQSENGQGSGSGSKKYETVSVRGQTVYDAFLNIQKTSQSRIVLHHSKIVIIGKALAERGIEDVSDYLLREREVRPTSWLVVSSTTAKEILEGDLGTGSIPAAGLVTMQENFRHISTAHPSNLIHFYMNLQGDSEAAVAPIIQKSGKRILFEETALFHKNRMVGSLTLNETRGLLWLENKLDRGNATLPFEDENSGLKTNVSVEINRGFTRIRPHFSQPAEITMEIHCRGQAQIRDAEMNNKILFNSETISKLEQTVEELLTKRIMHTIEVAQQKYNVDFVGFNNKFHNRFPRHWKNLQEDWRSIFPTIKTNLTVEIEIVRQGITKNPPEL